MASRTENLMYRSWILQLFVYINHHQTEEYHDETNLIGKTTINSLGTNPNLEFLLNPIETLTFSIDKYTHRYTNKAMAFNAMTQLLYDTMLLVLSLIISKTLILLIQSLVLLELGSDFHIV